MVLENHGETQVSFYIRKSISVGPFRFNLSKSGVSVSTGIKGFRVGMGPRGNYVHMGRNGVYFRASLPTSSPSNLRPQPSPPAQSQSPGVVMEEIESGSVSAMVDSSSAQLLEEINSKTKL